jgi:diguanylate cyclase (GGDEF)-like protein
VPIVDQSLDLMVQKIYDEVTYDASHDPLTGLNNRKEFERRLLRSLQSAKQDSSKHALCYIDLDKFKVINSNCGYEAGDKVLQDISRLLANSVPDEGMVARLGGNTFGVLIENYHEGEAYRLASTLIGQIQDYKFVFKQTPFQLGASVGLLTIDEEASDIQSLMESVEGASIGAKESGGNRINTYRPDDNEIQRRKSIMEWVAKLNRALDEDKLVLRLQPITALEPLDESDGWIKKKSSGLGSIGHCEVLLSVLDDAGDIIPPLEFIRAAERYNRMQAVDRWVIRRVFNWVATQRQ